MLNLQNLDCELAGGFIDKVTHYIKESKAESEGRMEEPILVFFSRTPNTSPPHVCHFSLNSLMCLLAAMGTTYLRRRITLHLTYLRQGRSAGGQMPLGRSLGGAEQLAGGM